MTTYTEQQAKTIRPRTYAYTMPRGVHVVKAHLKENAIAKLQQRYPDQEITDADVYESSTIISDCCDELVRVGWYRDRDQFIEEFAFKLRD